jgi:DNA-binding MarR family transcriptional regulator
MVTAAPERCATSVMLSHQHQPSEGDTAMDDTQTAPLSRDERDFWFAWKRVHEIVRARIAEDINAATGLSDPDTAILIRLEDASSTLRQSKLAEALGWDRTRLSHHLTRMQDRGLLSRSKAGNGVDVTISPLGRDAVESFRPLHAAAVRRYLIDPLSPADFDRLYAILVRLAEDTPAQL